MGKYPDMLFMRLLDDGLIDHGLYFCAVTQTVVHPHLQEVGVMGRKFADIGAGFLRSLRAVAVVRGVRFPGIFQKSAAGGIETRAPQGSGVLSVSYFVNLIIVLSEGRLVNRGNATGHPSFGRSASFSNQTLAQIEIFANPGKYEKKVYTLPKSLDEKVAALHLEKVGARLTTLRPDQAKYIGVPEAGPFTGDLYRY